MASDIVINNPKLNKGRLRYKHLIGKQFEMGINDCYSILVKLYKDNLNIELTNYARPNDWWLDDEMNLYLDNYRAEGFKLVDDVELKDLKPFDVFLIALPDPRRKGKTITNHCAIYLGDGKVLHHRLGKLSEVCNYSGYVRNLTTHVIRHKDVPDLTESAETPLDLMDFILPHKRKLLEEAMKDAN